MAIAFAKLKIHSQSRGQSSIAAAAYRGALRLRDEETGLTHNYETRREDVAYSEMLLPAGTPSAFKDPEVFWNASQKKEMYNKDGTMKKNMDAQLARDIIIALPREIDDVELHIEMANEFAERHFVERGIPVQVSVHYHSDGNPHAHLLASMRGMDGGEWRSAKDREINGGFAGPGLKVSDEVQWGGRWATFQNEYFRRQEIELLVVENNGIFVAQKPLGLAAPLEAQGIKTEIGNLNRAAVRENLRRVRERPEIILDLLTHQQATFTRRDIAKELHRRLDDPVEFTALLTRIETSAELVKLPGDGRSSRSEHYTTREMIAMEANMVAGARDMSERREQVLYPRFVTDAIGRMNAKLGGEGLSAEQTEAIRHVTGPGQLNVLVGYAGSGKTTIMEVAREAWETNENRVRGAALSGIAAENLQASGIQSRTLASLEIGWRNAETMEREHGGHLSEKQQAFIDENTITRKDIFVIDEAGMIGVRQFERVRQRIEKAGAKIVVLGDHQQLQSIEAGAALRVIAERVNTFKLMEVRRQSEPWAREATKALAEGRTDEAVLAYSQRGAVKLFDVPGLEDGGERIARAELVRDYMQAVIDRPDNSRVVMAHQNRDVYELNAAIRTAFKEKGGLQDASLVRTSEGKREFAPGDRILFRKNDNSLGVKNGSLGTVESADSHRMRVKLDNGKDLAFDVANYLSFDHGYAATVHKNQGVTADEAFVFVTKTFDRHLSYVAMSRHREALCLYGSSGDFKDLNEMARKMGRENSNMSTLDYGNIAVGREAESLDGLQHTGDRQGRNQDAFERPKKQHQAEQSGQGPKDDQETLARIEKHTLKKLRWPPPETFVRGSIGGAVKFFDGHEVESLDGLRQSGEIPGRNQDAFERMERRHQAKQSGEIPGRNQDAFERMKRQHQAKQSGGIPQHDQDAFSHTEKQHQVEKTKRRPGREAETLARIQKHALQKGMNLSNRGKGRGGRRR